MKDTRKLLLLVPLFTVITMSHAHADSMRANDSMMHGSMTKEMMSNQTIDLPLQQIKHGILAHDVKCNVGLTLIFKSTDGTPACVKTSTASILLTRGWAASENLTMKTMSQGMTGMHDMMNNTMTDGTMKGTTMNSMENKSMTKEIPSDNMKTSNDSRQMSQSNMDENKYPTAPKLVGISDYINTTPDRLAQEMKNKIIVYDFWTFNCINCIHTLPHVVDLSNKYLGQNVLVVGIHSPETLFEKDPNNVQDAVNRYNIKYPVVIDSEFQTWNAFGNHYWPHVYIVDAQGKIRYDHIGEGAYDEIDSTVASLLQEQKNQEPKELAMG